jgi:hypothetical protein
MGLKYLHSNFIVQRDIKVWNKFRIIVRVSIQKMNMKLNDEVNVLFFTFMLVKYLISDNYISTDENT